jgi:hypothetical protein
VQVDHLEPRRLEVLLERVELEGEVLGEVDVVLPEHREANQARMVEQRNAARLQEQTEIAVVADAALLEGEDRERVLVEAVSAEAHGLGPESEPGGDDLVAGLAVRAVRQEVRCSGAAPGRS